MRRSIITGIIFLLLATAGCKTSRVSSSSTSLVHTESDKDSTFVSDRVELDTALIKEDVVQLDLTNQWLSENLLSLVPGPDSVHISPALDPAPMYKRSGRANLSVERTRAGLTVRASCDSLLFILANRNREIYSLRRSADSTDRAMSSAVHRETIIPRIPLWLVIALILSVAVNALFVIRIIKTRIL